MTHHHSPNIIAFLSTIWITFLTPLGSECTINLNVWFNVRYRNTTIISLSTRDGSVWAFLSSRGRHCHCLWWWRWTYCSHSWQANKTFSQHSTRGTSTLQFHLSPKQNYYSSLPIETLCFCLWISLWCLQYVVAEKVNQNAFPIPLLNRCIASNATDAYLPCSLALFNVYLHTFWENNIAIKVLYVNISWQVGVFLHFVLNDFPSTSDFKHGCVYESFFQMSSIAALTVLVTTALAFVIAKLFRTHTTGSDQVTWPRRRHHTVDTSLGLLPS